MVDRERYMDAEIDTEGFVTAWKCSECGWYKPLRPLVRLSDSQFSRQLAQIGFRLHKCSNWPLRAEGASDQG